MFRTGVIGYLVYTLPAVALGIARRALDALCSQSPELTRGYTRPLPLASRPTFQHFVGRADQQLRAAKAPMIADGRELMEHVDRGSDLVPVEVASRAAAALAVQVASSVLTETVVFAGGGSRGAARCTSGRSGT